MGLENINDSKAFGVKYSAEASKLGITKDQFDVLDEMDNVKDGSISQDIWTKAKQLIAANKDGTLKNYISQQKSPNEQNLLVKLAKSLNLINKAEKKDYEIDVSAAAGVYGGNVSGFNLCEPNEDLYKEGERALEFYREKGSLDGFELNHELVSAGYNVDIEIETLFDDSSNDKSTAVLGSDGKYSVEVKEVSDGHKIVIRYSKKDEENGETFFENQAVSVYDRSTAGKEEKIKKPSMGV